MFCHASERSTARTNGHSEAHGAVQANDGPRINGNGHAPQNADLHAPQNGNGHAPQNGNGHAAQNGAPGPR